jgi:uncharacterized membrane protein
MIQPFTWTRQNGFVTAPSIPEVTPDLQQVYPCQQADYAFGLNDRGQVVGGNASLATYKWGFLWNGEDGASIIIPGFQSSAAAINNGGAVVGRTAEADFLESESAAVILQNGVTTELGSLVSPANSDSVCSAANGLNDMDQVVGWSTTVATSDGMPCQDMFNLVVPAHAFIWDAKKGMTDLGTLPGGFVKCGLKGQSFWSCHWGIGKIRDRAHAARRRRIYAWNRRSAVHVVEVHGNPESE